MLRNVVYIELIVENLLCKLHKLKAFTLAFMSKTRENIKKSVVCEILSLTILKLSCIIYDSYNDRKFH